MSAGRSARGPSTGWRPPFYCKATWRAVNPPRGRSRMAIGRQSTALMKLRSILIVLLIVVAALGIAAYQDLIRGYAECGDHDQKDDENAPQLHQCCRLSANRH